MKSNPAEERLTRGQRILLAVLWSLCSLTARMPVWYRYYLLKPLIFSLMVLMRYRRKVILQNLQRSFPERSHKEHSQIMRRYYGILSEVIVDTISLTRARPDNGFPYIRFRNTEEHIAQLGQQDWIAMASHYGCWEYLPMWSWFDPTLTFMGVYHPLKSPVFEAFYRRLRAFSPNIDQVRMKECVRYYLRNRSQENRHYLIGLIADQNPGRRPDSHWFRFLNQDTVFFDGAEKLALRFSLPVFFVHMERQAPGRYEAWFEMIYDGKEAVEEGEITRRYALLLEQMICRKPELWMWSHRRWKSKHREEDLPVMPLS